MKYYGIIKVFLDGELPADIASEFAKGKVIGSDFCFELDESNHFKLKNNPEIDVSGVAANTGKIDSAVQTAMGPILNHIVYLQQQTKDK